MDEKDWQEIRRLRLQYMGTSRGMALGNLIAEKQRLDKVRQIVKKELSPLSLDEMSNAEIQIREIIEQE